MDKDLIFKQDAIDAMQRLEDEDIETYGVKIQEGFDGERAIEALNSIEAVRVPGTFNREELMSVLASYFSIGDSYTYELNRVKEAFYIGTMTLEDFVEWDEDNVSDLCDYIMDKLFYDKKERQVD